jgi:hypothetical protein
VTATADGWTLCAGNPIPEGWEPDGWVPWWHGDVAGKVIARDAPIKPTPAPAPTDYDPTDECPNCGGYWDDTHRCPDPAPAPTGDQPTWTNFYDERARQRLAHVPSPGKDHWADRYAVDVSHLLGRVTELDAALVEAVHRSQQLDTALDVIAHLLQRHVPRADVRKWFVVFDAEYQVIDMPDEQAELLYQADAALAERRHRD